MECKNCGKQIHVKYCSYCGQETIKSRLSLKELLQKFYDALIHVDANVLRLVKNLTVKPAEISKEYIEGKRKKNFSPVNYLILVVTLSAILTLHYEKYGVPFEPVFPGDSDIDDIVEHQYFNHNYYKYLMFMSIPLAALVTMVVFRSSGLNYGENLVLNTYILAQVILLHSVLITPLIIQTSTFDDWIIFTYMILAVIYLTWSYTAFFKGRGKAALLKAILSIILFTIIYNTISHYLYYLFGRE